MALAVLTAAALRLTLPAALRFNDVSWLLGVFVVGCLAVLMIGDPGRIDRQATWLHVLTDILIGVIAVRERGPPSSCSPTSSTRRRSPTTPRRFWLLAAQSGSPT